MGSTEHDKSPHPHPGPPLKGRKRVFVREALQRIERYAGSGPGETSPLAPGEGGAKRRVREATFVGRHD